ncbi:tyrosine phosphatase (plasmid) [Ralstonia solanacearum]|nr:tyrosine phosphatase [Ralstonia solanacearum]AXW07944.1 tyrosine phosphatase [Ralstonia solanacearum]AXW82645.1 tyrosine phosphatase [Ralstonia solanacearum]
MFHWDDPAKGVDMQKSTTAQGKFFHVILKTFPLAALLTACSAIHNPITAPGIEGCLNFHEVEGTSGKLFRGGQPLDESEWNLLANNGIKTIIKLNRYSGPTDTDETEKMNAAKHGMMIIPIYMPPEDNSLGFWRAPDDSQTDKALTAISESTSHGATYVHCSHGKDRTGLVIALYQMRVLRKCKATAMKDLWDYGHSPWLWGITNRVEHEPEQPACIDGNSTPPSVSSTR